MDGLPKGGLGAPPWGRCWDEGSSQPQAAPGGIPTLLGGPQVLSLWVFIGWTSKGVTHRLEPGPHCVPAGHFCSRSWGWGVTPPSSALIDE